MSCPGVQFSLILTRRPVPGNPIALSVTYLSANLLPQVAVGGRVLAEGCKGAVLLGERSRGFAVWWQVGCAGHPGGSLAAGGAPLPLLTPGTSGHRSEL